MKVGRKPSSFFTFKLCPVHLSLYFHLALQVFVLTSAYPLELSSFWKVQRPLFPLKKDMLCESKYIYCHSTNGRSIHWIPLCRFSFWLLYSNCNFLQLSIFRKERKKKTTIVDYKRGKEKNDEECLGSEPEVPRTAPLCLWGRAIGVEEVGNRKVDKCGCWGSGPEKYQLYSTEQVLSKMFHLK